MKMNKKAWVARDYVVATLLFSAIIAICFIIIQLQGKEYNRTDIIDENFNESFNKFDDQTSMVSKSFNATSQGTGLSPLATFDLFFESTFTVIRLVFGSVSILRDQLMSMGSYFGISPKAMEILLILILSIITTILTFIVISSISRGKL